MTLPVAILAGGLATRLQPITEKIPKSLVDVAEKPFVVRQLEYLQQQSVEQVVLCISHLGEQIVEVVGDGSAFGIKVNYSWDGPTLLGTGGALRQALPLLGEHFFVYYGDSYLPINFLAVEQSFFASGKPALMTVMKNADKWDKSNVLFRDGCLVEYNKRKPKQDMKYIDYGLGVLSATAIIESVPLNEKVDLSDVYHELSIKGRLAGLEVFDRFYEIGSPRGLDETIQFFKEKEVWG